jgi:hypothetical protein
MRRDQTASAVGYDGAATVFAMRRISLVSVNMGPAARQFSNDGGIMPVGTRESGESRWKAVPCWRGALPNPTLALPQARTQIATT